MAIEIMNLRGEIAELYPQTLINIERYSSVFTEKDKLFQDISYPVKLPKSASNISFFGGGHLVDAANQTYQLEVQLTVHGLSMYAGYLEYSFSDNDFEALLLVNFGAISEKAKEILISEIYFDEPIQNISTSLMYDTCLHPKLYNFAFFPVYNKRYSGGGYQYPFTNFWNHASQTFVYDNLDEGGGGDPEQRYTRQSPFYKLKYILEKVCLCLGFRIEGDFINSGDAENIYIYTDIRHATRVSPSHLVLPQNITIQSFFKILKARFRLSLDFNILTGAVRISSSSTLLGNPSAIDISTFVSKISKFNIPTKSGYTINLKPDSTDKLFQDPKNTDEYISTDKLIVGNGENALEIDASTLKEETTNGYTYPITEHPVYFIKEANASQMLRFIYFKGFKNVGSGKIFPEARAMEISDDDIAWYRFLNDSKCVELEVFMPISVLSNFDISKKIGFTAEDGAYVYAVAEYLKFSLSNEDSDLIRVEIKCWLVNYQPTTVIAKQPIENNTLGGKADNYEIKALFNEQNIPRIDVSLFYPAGTRYTNASGYTETLSADLELTGYITRSTDKFRAGGTKVFTKYLNVILADYHLIELRVQQKPEKLIFFGHEYSFTQHSSGYWYVKNMDMYGYVLIDALIFWIVF